MTALDLPEGPLDIRGLLDGAMKGVRATWRKALLPAAAPLMVAGGVIPVLQFLLGGYEAHTPSSGTFFVNMGLGLVSIALHLVVHEAMVVGAHDAVVSGRLSMKDAFLFMLGPRALGSTLLKLLVATLGLVCCVLPGMYLYLIMGVVTPVMRAERLFGAQAMKRSHALMAYNPRGRFGDDGRVKLFLLMVVTYLLISLAGFLIQLPLMVVMFGTMMRQVAAGSTPDMERIMSTLLWIQVPTNVAASVVTAGVYGYGAFGTALLYRDQRARKEGFDLETQLDALAGAGPLPEPSP